MRSKVESGLAAVVPRLHRLAAAFLLAGFAAPAPAAVRVR